MIPGRDRSGRFCWDRPVSAPVLKLDFVLHQERGQELDGVGGSAHRTNSSEPGRSEQTRCAGQIGSYLSLASTDRPCSRIGTTVWSR